MYKGLRILLLLCSLNAWANQELHSAAAQRYFFNTPNVRNSQIDFYSYPQTLLSPAWTNLDWLAYPDPECHLCNGYYAPLAIPFTEVEKISADQVIYGQKGTSELKGNVIYQNSDKLLHSEHAYIYRHPQTNQPQQLDALNNVEWRTEKFRFTGSFTSTNLKTQATIVKDAHLHYYAKHARASADWAFWRDKYPILLFNASYTTCPPGNCDWYLAAKQVNLDPKTETGNARQVTLYFKRWPILYSPYLSFPISSKRKTGFLTPSIEYQNHSGLIFKLPYYFNLAPNYDLTFTPRYYVERGAQLGLDLRYLTAHDSGDVFGEYFPYDRKFAQYRQQTLATNTLPADDPRVIDLQQASPTRTAITVYDDSHWGRHWSGHVNFNHVSDSEYLIDLGNHGIYTTMQNPYLPGILAATVDHNLQLPRQADLDYQDQHLKAQLLIKDYQTLHPYNGPPTVEPYIVLPQLNLLANYPDLGHWLDYDLFAQFTNFATPENPTPIQNTHGYRSVIIPKLTYPLKATYGFFTPSLDLRFVDYQLSFGDFQKPLQYPSQQNYFFPIFSLDTGLYFDRNLHAFNQRLRQTLEPRLFYLLVPYVDQTQAPVFDSDLYFFDFNQLFRTNLFSGYDRQSNANQISLALTSRFLNDEGAELLKLNLGQIYYFTKDQVSLCLGQTGFSPNCVQNENPDERSNVSPLIAMANLNLGQHWTLNLAYQWDPYLQTTNEATVNFNYLHDDKIIDLEYSQIKASDLSRTSYGNIVAEGLQDVAQMKIGFKWPLTKNWKAIGLWSYDLNNNYDLADFAGLEYESCCWSMQVGYRRYIKLRQSTASQVNYGNIVYLQVVLKGLAGVGHRADEWLMQNLAGYQSTLNKIY